MKKLFLLFLLCSCCSTKPVVIERIDCNDKAILNYIIECVPKTIKDSKEYQHYYQLCSQQAKQKYCIKKQLLIIKGVKWDCDTVPEKLKIYCK